MSWSQGNDMPPGIQALADELHVWWFGLDLDAGRVAQLAALLSDVERARAARFHFAKHRQRYIAGRGMLREILAAYTGIAAGSLRFACGVHGKPRLDDPKAAGDIAFNASHSHAVGAVAIGWRTDIGLDLECVLLDRDHERIARGEFAGEEVAWLDACAESARQYGFYAIWTCKEAYLKGKGVGLSASLKGFAIDLRSQGAPRLLRSDIDAADPGHWSFHRPAMPDGVVAAVAVDRCLSSVRSAEWVPLRPGLHAIDAGQRPC